MPSWPASSTSTSSREPSDEGRVALGLAIASLFPCLWVLGPVAYFLAEGVPGRRGRSARVLALIGSTFLLLAFLYALPYIAGTIASPR